MAAPTEAEIRGALEDHERRYVHDRVADRVMEAIDQAFTVITYTALDAAYQEDFDAAALTDMWSELPASAQAELADMIERAKARALESAHEAIRREVVAAALAFGVSHPYAGRVARAVPA